MTRENNGPSRLQLRRVKGFDLQAESHARNGLRAVVVARPGRWGNPFDFRSSDWCWVALSYGCRADGPGRQEASVRAFRDWVTPRLDGILLAMERGVSMGDDELRIPLGRRLVIDRPPPALCEIRAGLGGANLACWCKPGSPCHADVLLELANPG